MADRWRQVFRAREVTLDPFTQADLDAVRVDPEGLPASVRGPAPREAAPLLAALAADRGAAGDRPGSPPAPASPDVAGGGALAAAAARLEQLGYLRPGEPGEPGEAAAADSRIPAELAGWAADPAGGWPRRVTIRGDLGIVARIRGQPYCVAEAAASAEPTRPDPLAGRWRLVARLYAAWSPPVGLIERPAGPDGTLPPLTMLTQEFGLAALMNWCGVGRKELLDAGQGRSEAERRADAARWPPSVATAELADGFAGVARLTVAHPDGPQVLLRRLIVASGPGGQRWMLEGEWAERAVPVSVDQIGERLEVLFRAPGEPG